MSKEVITEPIRAYWRDAQRKHRSKVKAEGVKGQVTSGKSSKIMLTIPSKLSEAKEARIDPGLDLIEL